MIISSKGRYAIRIMVDLAEHCPMNGAPSPLKEIAQRLDISLKYMESILTTLSKARLVEGLHGKGGGYRLTRPAAEYTVGEILRLTEGTLCPVSCHPLENHSCPHGDSCKALPMWQEVNKLVNDYFDGITLASLASTSCKGEE